MPRVYYENFDLSISRIGDKAYKANVQGASGGEASVNFTLDGAPDEVITAVTRKFSLDSAPQSNADATTSTAGSSQEVGKYLYQSLFHDKMLATLLLTLDRARGRNANLRLRLNLTNVPELVGLPWERLRSETDNLALSIQTSIVRYQNATFPGDELVVKDKPLQMLVVISNPATVDAPALNVEDEWQKLNNALKPLIDQKLIALERLPRATLKDLDDRFFDPDRPVNIFHYIGHGRFDAETGAGQLLFEVDPGDDAASNGGTAGGFEPVSGERLGQSLRNQRALRLATLNSCESSMVSTADSYAGVAQQLLHTGNVPVVVAMRKAISDDLAIAFAQTFFKWLLVNNLSVDVAITRARMRMRDVEQKRLGAAGTPTEWATPTLFMRHHDGYLVDFQGVSGPVIPDTLPDEADPAMAKHYQTVLNALTRAKLVPFLGLDINLFGRAPMDNWQPNTATLPSYRELVNYLVTLSQHPNAYVPALADVSQFAFLQYLNDEDKGEGTFYNDLGNIFMRGSAPTAFHQFWATLAAYNDQLTGSTKESVEDVNRRFLIVSSTYDNLLEKAFKQKLARFHVVSYVAHGDNKGKFRHTVYAKTGGDEPMAQPPTIIEQATTYGGLYDKDPVILKIPGTVGDTSGPRFAITEDQYLDFFAKRELASILPSQLLTKLRSSNHLFLGYNVREWSLRALLYRIWEDHKAPQASFSVQGDPSEVEKRYWKACSVKIIERELMAYLNGLRNSCQTLLPGVQL